MIIEKKWSDVVETIDIVDLEAAISRLKEERNADIMKKDTDRMIDIIRLRFVDKMTISSIAKEKNISTQAVKSWVEKSIRWFRKDLEITPW
jgi:DNA-directed RNA polymerase sigma subunit (sigma70/sigma32)